MCLWALYKTHCLLDILNPRHIYFLCSPGLGLSMPGDTLSSLHRFPGEGRANGGELQGGSVANQEKEQEQGGLELYIKMQQLRPVPSNRSFQIDMKFYETYYSQLLYQCLKKNFFWRKWQLLIGTLLYHFLPYCTKLYLKVLFSYQKRANSTDSND